MSKKYAEVVFPQTVNRSFTYAVPPDLKELARIGCRVIAPFGNRKLTGFIVGFLDHTDLTEVKFIQDVLDAQPIFTDDLLELMHWISEYYISPLGDAMKAGIPTNLLQQSKKFVEVIANQPEEAIQTIEKTAPPRQAQILRYVLKSGRISLQQLKRRIGAKSLVSSLNQLEARGLVRMDFAFTTNLVKPKLQKFVKINPDCQILPQQIDELKTRAPQQAACLEFLEKNHLEISLKELMQRLGIYSSSLKSLASKGLITIYEKEILRDYYQQTVPPEIEKLTLNSEQQQSLNAISSVLKKPQFQTFLLHGVTGSGKTQVYIDAIYQVLAQGKDAIVLVPEISLTPQTVARFRSHFKEQVAVLHSAMSVGERFDSWRRLRSGAAQVAIGPRSAVFAPLKNIGLIIVDEEHEGSYKQSDLTPRYHARDVAIMRAKILNAVVVLGSATPSAESFYNAKIGKYQLLQLTHRIDHIPLPEVQILDLIKERRLSGKKSPPVFSRLLKQKIEQKLAKKEQTILLLNRRGFSSYIKCKDCGFIANCESCHITLTYHLRGRRLRCHYCGFTKKAPERCPECSGSDILFRGVGTQQVEEELKIAFPQARVVRMDLDTTARKRSHDRILNDFADGKYDILLGTQMVAKGLDFAKVTLVGVINADVGMLIPDFRSSERTFQLLTQVAGRAGRKDLPGEVIIQTYSPDSFCLTCAQKHDFVRFFNGEIVERRELIYPPFGRITCIQFKGKDEANVRQSAHNYAQVLKSLKGAHQVMGPTPAPISKIQNKYRWQILLKSDKHVDVAGRILRQAVLQTEKMYRDEFKTRGVQITVDVDPVSLI